MIPVPAAVVRNTNSVAVRHRKIHNLQNKITVFIIERGDFVVELDQYKYTLGTYEKPLIEVGDSL